MSGRRRSSSQSGGRDLPPLDPPIRNVLVIEADRDLRAWIAAVLDGARFRTFEAWNVREAIGLLVAMEEPPAIIIADPTLTDFDRFRAWQKGHSRYGPAPLLAIAAPDGARVLARGWDADGFLAKPLDEETLLLAARELARG